MRLPKSCRAVCVLIVLCAAAAPAAAQTAPPAVIRSLLDCRALAESVQRLACLDAATTALADAVAKRDVVVADKEQISTARRRLFGIALPDFKLFGTDDRDDAAPADRIDRIDARLVSVRAATGGNWQFGLDDGSVWLQTDGRTVPRAPRAGMAIGIRRAALGAFLANIDGQIAVRVRRINQ